MVADGAMYVTDGEVDGHGRAVLQRRLGLRNQFVIERLLQSVVLRLDAVPGHTRRQRWIVEDGGKIDSARLPVANRSLNVEHVHTSDHVVKLLEAKICHVLAHLLGNKEKVV